MAILKLQTNVPEVIALQFATGKIAVSTIPNAPNQVLFTLCDGRKLYLPLSVADRIRDAGITAGRTFQILKVSAHDYRVGILAESGVAQTAHPPVMNNDMSREHSPAPPPPPALLPPPPAPPPQPAAAPPPGPATVSPLVTTKLMGCLMAAIDAAIEAETYATRKGLELRFSSEDIRTMANTIAMNGGVR